MGFACLCHFLQLTQRHDEPLVAVHLLSRITQDDRSKCVAVVTKISADAGDDSVELFAQSRRVEWLLRGFALLAYGFAVVNLAALWWADRSRWTLLLLLLTEGFTLMLVLLARPARVRDATWAAVLLNLYPAFSYVLFDPRTTTQLIPELAGAAFQVSGTLWQFAAKAVIGRSFGLLPALRGVAVGGPYRIVRHPIYLVGPAKPLQPA